MSTITPSRPRVRVFRVGHEYALLVVLCQNVLVGPMMGDDDVDDVGDDVLSCPGSYYRFSPTLLPTRRELKLNCSRSHQSSVLERSYSDTPPLEQPPMAAQAQMSVKPFWSSPLTCQADAAPIQLAWFYPGPWCRHPLDYRQLRCRKW